MGLVRSRQFFSSPVYKDDRKIKKYKSPSSEQRQNKLSLLAGPIPMKKKAYIRIISANTRQLLFIPPSFHNIPPSFHKKYD